MTTLKQYVTTMQARQQVIATKLGADITQVDKQLRVMNLALLSLIAVLIKVLVDKGIITDAELVAMLNTARDDTYTDEPINPPPPA